MNCLKFKSQIWLRQKPDEVFPFFAEPQNLAVLTPEWPQELHGVVDNVVFPTGIDRRDDLGLPDRFDVYYGMADKRIGVARLDLPEILPQGESADPPEAKGGRV